MSERLAVVYRCINPAPVSARIAEHEAECEQFTAEVKELKASLDGHEILGIDFYTGGFAITGYRMRDRDDLLPGFRRDGSSMRAVPAKRTPEGKAWAERLRKLVRSDRKMPGFPERMHTEGYALYPNVEQVCADYFLKISMEPSSSESAKIDRTIWEPANLSDYYLAKEAVPAP